MEIMYFHVQLLSLSLFPRLIHITVYESERKSLSCVYPMDYSLPGSSIHGIFQARILEWVAISFSREEDLPDTGIEPGSPAL